MGTFKTFAIYAGAVICFGGLIFAGIRMMSGRFQDAIPGLFGALFLVVLFVNAWMRFKKANSLMDLALHIGALGACCGLLVHSFV